MENKTTEPFYTFSVIYTEAESNLGLFYQESHAKSSLDAEDTSVEDILTRILEDLKAMTIRVVDDRLMVVRGSNRFTFTNDLEDDDGYYMLAILPGDDEEQIPVEPNITEEAAIGMRPFWYDGSGMRKVSEFDGFVEVFGKEDAFFDEVKTIAQNEILTFYPSYLCLDEKEVDPKTITTQMTEVKVSVK